MSKADYFTNFKIIVEVLNSILGLPHFNSRALQFNSRTTVLDLPSQEVFEVGLSKCNYFTNINMITAFTTTFSLVVQFSICVLEVPNSVLEMCWRFVVKLLPNGLYLLPRAFGLVAWFSLRVREVPSSILGMPQCDFRQSQRDWL